MQTRNLLLAVSFIANVILFGLNMQSKALDVRIKETVAKQMPGIARHGFVDGCVMAVATMRQMNDEQPDYQLYKSWCQHNSESYKK